jgi:hypothetical protein
MDGAGEKLGITWNRWLHAHEAQWKAFAQTQATSSERACRKDEMPRKSDHREEQKCSR